MAPFIHSFIYYEKEQEQQFLLLRYLSTVVRKAAFFNI